MDEAKTRGCIQDHSDVGKDESVAMIRYTGDSGQVTIRTRWQDRGGQLQIVAGEPVA